MWRMCPIFYFSENVFFYLIKNEGEISRMLVFKIPLKIDIIAQ